MEKWINTSPELASLFAGDHPSVSWIRSPNDAPSDSPLAARATSHGDFDNRRFHVVTSTIARIRDDAVTSLEVSRFQRTAASRSARRAILNDF
jgi:hypothetical protein